MTQINHSAPAAPPTTPREEEVELLLRFLRGRDVHCPRCDYNVRNLTRPVCPECQHDLHLSVGLGRPRFGWLIAALAPGIFSGIAAFFMGCMLIMMNISPTGKTVWQAYVLDGFGWLSAFAALMLFRNRYQFLRQLANIQMSWVAAIWFVHVAFFVYMWMNMR